MEAISYTQARNKLSSLMDQVCEDHDPIIITRQKQQAVIIMSLDDYNALEETAYLMQSPKNAQRLNQAITDFKKGRNYLKQIIL